MQRIQVKSSAGNYSILCGHGLLGRAGRLIAGLGPATGIFLLSSPRVWKHWGAKLSASIPAGGDARQILFEDREAAKNLGTMERVCRALVRAGADRNAILVALGGGVVGDVAGFAAACYFRGVRLVHVPTTVVAQADSSIGGKTGVNLPEGKNLVGAFHAPRLVLTDPDLLRTLPGRQYRSGLYEVIKYGVIRDADLFAFLERRMDALLRRERATLDWVLPRCIRVKAGVVSRDERESGLREALNLGHTAGHALEAVSGYGRILHGEAVGWGLLAASCIAAERGLLARREGDRIARLIARVGKLPPVRRAELRGLRAAMRRDKKARGGRLRWVLPRRIGRVEIVSDVPETVVRKVIARLPDLLPR